MLSIRELDDEIELLWSVAANGSRPNKMAIRADVRRRLIYEVQRAIGVRVLGANVRFNRSRYRVRRKAIR